MPRVKTTMQNVREPEAPAISHEAREMQLVALAEKLAEQQLRDGTASSQVISHYLKLGSSKEYLERRILEKQSELMEAKTAALKSQQRIEELYADAIAAMKRYGGQGEDE